MTSEMLPRGYNYSYTDDLLRIAKDFNSNLIVKKSVIGHFIVYIDMIFLSNPKRALAGQGSTLEDACEDFMRQARGEVIHHVITNKEGSYV